VKPFVDKKLDGGIGNLPASALNQVGVFDLGGNIFGSDEVLHINPIWN
jgi:hypothetical protein